MNKLLRKSELFIRRNSSTILTCVGAAGVIATTAMAVRATPKALARIEEAEKEKNEPLTKMETVVVAAPAYIPTVVTGAATIACIFGANVLNKRQQASMASAYALLDSSYKDYRNKVKELYGEEADRQVVEKIAKDKYDESDISSEDKLLFYEEFSGRFFESTMEDVVRAEYEINKKISLWGGADLNDFYDLLNIPKVDYGHFLGWSEGGLMEATWTNWLDFQHEKTPMEDGMECIIITMSHEPMYDYEYY